MAFVYHLRTNKEFCSIDDAPTCSHVRGTLANLPYEWQLNQHGCLCQHTCDGDACSHNNHLILYQRCCCRSSTRLSPI